jgi:hypothetical protein
MIVEPRACRKGEFFCAVAERYGISAIGATSAASMKAAGNIFYVHFGGRLAPKGKRGR